MLPADGGDGLRTRIRGIEEALGSHGGGELGRHNAGLDDGEEVFFIDLDDLVQSLRQDDHGFVGVGARSPPLRLVPAPRMVMGRPLA